MNKNPHKINMKAQCIIERLKRAISKAKKWSKYYIKQRNWFLGKPGRDNLEKFVFYANEITDQDHLAINLGTDLDRRKFIINNRRQEDSEDCEKLGPRKMPR